MNKLEEIESGVESASIYAKDSVEIENFNDIKWLINRVKKLEAALENAETDFCVLEQYDKAEIARKALEE